MGLADRDYMRDRVRRTIERERAGGSLFGPIRRKHKPWVVLTAVAVLALLFLVYVY